jgi:hypothetical protein
MDVVGVQLASVAGVIVVLLVVVVVLGLDCA